MRGVGGIRYKKSGSHGPAPAGEGQVKVLESLAHRGKGSHGVTVVGEDGEGGVGAPALIDQAGRNLGPHELGLSSGGRRALHMWA